MTTTVLPDTDRRLLRHGATLGGVFAISLTLLLAELLLTRVFSVLFMYHFAFMVISLALFGMGVGGIMVYLRPAAFAGDLQRHLVRLCLLFAASIVVLVLFLFNLPLTTSADWRGTLTVAAVYVMSALPFFVGGTCLSLLLSRAGQDVNRVYFVDLLGAGVACLLIIPALDHLGGVTGLLATSVGAALAATLFALAPRPAAGTAAAPGRLLERTLAVLALVAVAGTALVLLAEPLAAWLGEIIFAAHPISRRRTGTFEAYFTQYVQPEIRAIAAGARGPLAAGAVLFGAAWLAVRSGRGQATVRGVLARHELRLAAGAVLLAVTGFVTLNAATDAVRIRFAKGRVEFRNLYEGWNSFSRVVVLPRHGTSANTYAWGLSPRYDGPPGEHLALDIDSLAGTPLVRFDGDLDAPSLEHLEHDVTALAYELRPGREALVIGPGGGRDVLTALKYGSPHVTAVELNPLMAEVVNERFGDFTGRLYLRPDVDFVVDDGRHYVRRTDRRFGVIQLALVDTWAATAAGAFALSENTLYTVEAFGDYLRRLEPDGVLTISRWLDDPPRETLRVVTLAREALRRQGVADPRNHVIVAGTPPLRRGHKFASVVVAPAGFTAGDLQTTRAFARDRGFDVLYMPGTPVDPVFSEVVLTPDLGAFLAGYELDVSPSTDNRPFFFNTVKPADFLRPWEDKPGRMGVQVLAQLVLVVSVLVVLFMIVPLYVRRRSVLAAVAPGPRWATLLYFAALGAGFMLIEVCLISKFVLFLGHPIHALTVVLCSLLVAAGCGSYWSGRYVGAGHAPLRRVIAAALAAIVALTLVLDLVFTRLLPGASFPLAAALSVLVLAPTGFLMGMPFPLGLRLLDRVGPQWGELVPWVWGINGATSVIGSVLAISIAINLGLVATLLVGLGFYAVAFVTAGYLAGGAMPAETAEPAPAPPAMRAAAGS